MRMSCLVGLSGLLLAGALAGCQLFGRGALATLNVTSEPSRAWVYLIPIEYDPEEVDLEQFDQSRRTAARGMKVLPGSYWLVVRKSERQSRPREIVVELGTVNEEHVDFDVED